MAESARDGQSTLVIVDWTGGGNSLRLAVEGYESPGNTSMYDEEWLMIAGEVACEDGSWKFRDPSLMSSELIPLATYLTADGPGKAEHPTSFVEPVLTFAKTGPETVTVYFWLEAAPPWLGSDYDYGGDYGFPLTFTVTDLALRATADGLRSAARRFPPQGPNTPHSSS